MSVCAVSVKVCVYISTCVCSCILSREREREAHGNLASARRPPLGGAVAKSLRSGDGDGHRLVLGESSLLTQ